MDYAKKLKGLAGKNEVRIDDHKGYKNQPPYFYNSLKKGFDCYFRTFIKRNETYDAYISATATANKKSLKILETYYLDEENTVLSLVSFERFFELFIKDLLRKTNPKLAQTEARRSSTYPGPTGTWNLITKIQSGSFVPSIPNIGEEIHKPPFRETLKRFYDLIDYTKDPTKNTNRLVKKFSGTFRKFDFLDDDEHKSTLWFINWYRDNILHKGSKLPTLRFLDYIVTQKIIPIAKSILEAEDGIPQAWLFFTKTITGIDILDELMNLKFEATNAKGTKKANETFNTLLLVGHLKELGRANMNMNNAIKNNSATYEYNYKDPIVRGERFAHAERDKHPHAVGIKRCPCCGVNSMVLYRIHGKDLPMPYSKNIDWIKCYTCDYHLRYNVFDLHYFNENSEKHFDY